MNRVLHAIAACSVATASDGGCSRGRGRDRAHQSRQSQRPPDGAGARQTGRRRQRHDQATAPRRSCGPLTTPTSRSPAHSSPPRRGRTWRTTSASLPCSHASRTGDAAMVDLLLRAGANPSLAHPEGETPLMAAAQLRKRCRRARAARARRRRECDGQVPEGHRADVGRRRRSRRSRRPAARGGRRSRTSRRRSRR